MVPGGPSIRLRPLYSARMARGWAIDVPVVELASVAASTDAPQRLRASRGYLNDSSRAAALLRLLETRPADFGRAGAIVLGAEHVTPVRTDGAFATLVQVDGLECIDGLQRLRAIAEACATMEPSELACAVVRLEILLGDEREAARRAYAEADRFTELRTAQDSLIDCPNIARLMRADWEREQFDPRRGMVAGLSRETYTMAEVTRALASLSGPGPDIAHEASTSEGLEALWSDRASESYRTLFHPYMEPIGIMRAVKVWRAANAALESMPLSRRNAGHGKLVTYAPAIICWEACRFLPPRELHVSASEFRWDDAVETRVGYATLETADRLIRQYENLEKGRHKYIQRAPQLSLWKDLVS
ncbi:hypothetical protein [Streptomyces cyaneofuscatus]|uniref:hypothetical protein n=1 Tax=Streptomyces cyaneofuscatus TaxID=66883 RepID=UPI0037F199CE